ncbi:MAG: small multi-drug export protein [Candidatus Gracilibacteria bacterium]|nr:small multi-drug export protein [bacterium]MDZ4217136.1 small multi-drug export protein [Candidatus Gracilibacteria bacterium]
MSISLFLRIAFLSSLPVTEHRFAIPLFLSCNKLIESNGGGALESAEALPSWLPEIIFRALDAIANCSGMTAATPIWFIFTAGVIGNMIPIFFVLWFLPHLTKWLHDHMAPRINRFVIWLHEIFVKNNRLHLLYLSVILLTLIAEITIFWLGINAFIWHAMVLVAIPLWAYIMFIIAKKAYHTALEETSIIHWFYDKVSKEHSEKFYRWGAIVVVLIAGLPIPGTGSWTAALVAFLFNMPYWKSVWYVFLGVLMAGVIITAISTGLLHGVDVISGLTSFQ